MNKKVKKILIIDRNRLDGIFRSAYTAKLLKKRKNYESIILTENKKQSQSVKTFKKLGFNEFIFLSNQNKSFANLSLVFLALLSSFFLFLKICFKKSYILTNYRFSGIKIGDMLVDHLARYDSNFFDKEFFNINTFKSIYNVLFNILFIKRFIKINNVKLLISTSYSYASISSIGIRVGLILNAKVLMITGSSYKIFKKYEESLKGFGKFEKKDFLEFFKNSKNKIKSKKYFKSRINASSLKKNLKDITKINKHDWDVYRSFYKKKNYSKSDFYKLLGLKDINKPICTFALHAFRDANHVFGDLIFESFYDEFLETIDFLKKYNNFYWLIKIHPSAEKYGEKGLVEKVLNRNNIKNLKILPNYISTKTILNLSDKLVTSRGTIALEFAALGKKSIITAETYYKNFGITLNPVSKEDYFKKLIDNNFPRKMNYEKSTIAERILYFMKIKLVRDNIYNFTDPAVEIGDKEFLKRLEKKIPSLYKNKNSFFKLYDKMISRI